VGHCLESGKELSALTWKELKGFHPLIQKDVLPRLKADQSVNSKRTLGGTSGARVTERISEIEKGS